MYSSGDKLDPDGVVERRSGGSEEGARDEAAAVKVGVGRDGLAGVQEIEDVGDELDWESRRWHG